MAKMSTVKRIERLEASAPKRSATADPMFLSALAKIYGDRDDVLYTGRDAPPPASGPVPLGLLFEAIDQVYAEGEDR
jgi:hypothetical protein